MTDIGTRTLIAVAVTEREKADTSWLNGPPFAVQEMVFDENDFPGIEINGD